MPFSYKFQVEEESPGTYWYPTHSGPLGVEAHNMMKAPLIVHPNTAESKVLVDRLNNRDELLVVNPLHIEIFCPGIMNVFSSFPMNL